VLDRETEPRHVDTHEPTTPTRLRSGSGVVALLCAGTAAVLAAVALAAAATTRIVCPPGYVPLIDPRILIGGAGVVILLISALTLIAALGPGRHVVAATVAVLLSAGALAVLIFAVSVHVNHGSSACWTF
jgi:hypothetical protein